MTDNTPTPSVQPFRAWAVRAEDGSISADTRWSKDDAEAEAIYLFGYDEIHRVIRVEIREVNDE